MKAIKNIAIWLTLFFYTAARLHAQVPVVVVPSGPLVLVGTSSLIYFDETAALSAAQLASGQYNAHFTPLGKEVVNYGVTSGRSWCKFRLANAGSEKVYIAIQNPILEDIQLYIIRDNQAIPIGSGGLFVPMSSRQVQTENNMFDLHASSDTTTYLIGIKTGRVHTYYLSVGHFASHLNAINTSSLWSAIFIGFALLMALYHLFLYISIRNIPYLLYVGYVLTLALFNMHLNGSTFLYLWPANPSINQYDNVFSSSAGIFSTLFAITCLDLKKQAPLYYKLAATMCGIYMANTILSIAGFSHLAFLAVRLITAVWTIISIITVVKVLRAGYRPARFFLLAWLVMISGVFFLICNSLQLIGYSFLLVHSLQIATFLEALILSFALADRFITYKREKEALMLSQTQMLEHMVAERTEQLNKQQQETEQLLLNILPEEVAAELKEKGAAQSRNYEAVTVLFTDFKDFTQIVENITPEQLIAHLNHCFSAFDKIIEKYGIEKIKTIGDSYMCAGGFGNNDPANAINVVRAGIEIRNFIDNRNAEARQKNGIILEVRIGIHTGPVIAGIIGIKKFAYDIWGDTVNIASRMESAGEIGKVNISGETYDIVKNEFTCTYRGRMPAKNKGEVDMYFVEWR